MSKNPQAIEGIDQIIFDLGGVLLNIDNRLTEQAFVRMGARDFSKYFGHGFAASFFRDYELGKINDASFVQALRSMADLQASDREIIDAWNALLLDFPKERLTLLQKLATHYRLFLFSNTNALHLQGLQEIFVRTFGRGSLEDYFEKTYYSHLVGKRKPDVDSYLLVIQENGLNPQRTLFVDDAKVNIEGAEKAGLKGLWLDSGRTVLDIAWL